MQNGCNLRSVAADIIGFMEQLKEWLGKHPVLNTLDKNGYKAFVTHAIRRDLQKGEALALQGDVWPYLLLVAEGEVDAIKVSTEGRNLVVTTFCAGELFWGPAFFQNGAPLLATLEAHYSSCIYLWPRQRIESAFIANGRLSWELCCLMIQRMQRASAIVEELAFQPIARRLASHLLGHFESAGDASIHRNLTLDEMAARVGTTREMVCRALYSFADKKFINITRTEFVLTDKEGLENIAGGS